MKMENKYIILQTPRLKVPLLAGDSTWDVTINSRLYSIDIFMEALFASLIYDGDNDSTKEIMHYIAERYDKRATPVQTENFITLFKGHHRAIPATEAELGKITLLGSDDEGCCIPIYKYVCAVTKDIEKEWVDEINSDPHEVWIELHAKILRHIQKYDQCFYPKWGIEEEASYILNSFLRTHGLPVTLSKQQPPTKEEKREESKYYTCVVMVFCLIVFMATCNSHGDSFKEKLVWSSIFVFGLCSIRLLHLFALSSIGYEAFWKTIVGKAVRILLYIVVGIATFLFIDYWNDGPRIPGDEPTIWNKISDTITDWVEPRF